MFTDNHGRDGIALGDVLDENSNKLVGNGPVLTDYTEAVIPLRLEVSFAPARMKDGRLFDSAFSGQAISLGKQTLRIRIGETGLGR